MVEKVIESGEISLNSVYYPIKGRVNRSLISTMPAKVTIGEYTLADEQVASSWATSDQRGGMLCEEMDEATQLDRSYWSTSEGRYKGHLTLPTLATLATAPTTPTAVIVNGDMELDSDWTGANFSRDGTYFHGGTYSRRSAAAATMYQDVVASKWAGGLAYTFTCYGLSVSGAATVRVAINDGVSTTNGSTVTPGAEAWSALTVTKTLSTAATMCRVIVEVVAANGTTSYFDDAAISQTGSLTLGTSTCFCNFSGNTYASYGQVLTKLNSTSGSVYDYLAWMPATITDLIGTINSTMLIFLGDTINYYYMSTSDALTQTNVTAATKGIIWDGKAFKLDNSGNMTKTATPNSATPTWTDADAGYSLSDLGASAVKSLAIYRDASGNSIIYTGTNQGLWAYDLTDSMWLLTELEVPNHATSGMGLTRWRDVFCISAGLDIHKYIAGGTATITQVGLNNDDGLPKLRGGEIVKLIKGYNEVFALVDSTYEGATSYSTMMSYDGTGWQCAWEATAVNKNMYSGIVSSVYAHRLWFSTTDGVYYIPLQRNIRNPKKITSYPYAATSTHITPWFDAGWIGNKLALSQTVFCKDTTTSETVGVLYRIDHTSTGIASTWVSLGTIDNTGEGVETTYTFGTNAVGLVNKAIQFQYNFVGSSTKSGDILYTKHKYLKLLNTKWGWTVTIDCNKEYKGNTPSQLMAALDTVVALNTLAEFTYRDSTGTYTSYVKVSNAQDVESTGEDWRGIYSLALVQP